jgi:alanine racemase
MKSRAQRRKNTCHMFTQTKAFSKMVRRGQVAYGIVPKTHKRKSKWLTEHEKVISVVIKEMQIKTTTRYYSPPPDKSLMIPSVGRDVEWKESA